MLYQITATVIEYRRDGNATRQVPTFFLDDNIQGIRSKQHAKEIAEQVINPLGLPNLTISAEVTVV